MKGQEGNNLMVSKKSLRCTICKKDILLYSNMMLRNSTQSREKTIVAKYLVTAPIERPQRPIQETCLLLRRKDTAHLRSCFWEYRSSNVFQNTAIKI
jgi:hypothetical protein